jgi:hypothetical protein
LAQTLAASPEAQRCFVTSLYGYASGRPVFPGDACAIERHLERFRASGTSIPELVVSIVTDEDFVARKM